MTWSLWVCVLQSIRFLVYAADMEISMDDLVQMGRHAFEVVCRSGQFFFPKVAIGRMAENTKIEIGQYEGELDQYEVLLNMMALTGPIDWIGHTADSYQYFSNINDAESMRKHELILED